ncbi:helix-turn-helix domain-containing protein [Streptococcus suis]
MTFFIHNFGKNLSRLRKEKGLTQDELAQIIGVQKAAISKIESGTSYPTFANLDKIAEFFNVTPNQLFGTPTQIELENSVYKTDEYSEKAKIILSAIEKMEELKNNKFYYDILWLSRGPQRFTPDGEPLYEDYDGRITSNPDSPIDNAYYPGPVDNLLKTVEELQKSGTYSELLRLTRGPQKFAPNGDELYEDYDGSITNVPDYPIGFAYYPGPVDDLLKTAKEVLENAEAIRDLANDVAYIKENLDILKKDSE